MSDKSDEKMALIKLIGDAFKLEMKTDGGRYNIYFTGAIAILVVIYIATEPFMAAIYVFGLKQPYPGLPFYLYIGVPVGWGLLCFIYMIFIADKIAKSKKLINKNNNL